MVDLGIEGRGLEALAEALGALPEELRRELRAANERIGDRLTRDARQILATEVYAVPVPVTGGGSRGRKTGRKWNRSGSLFHRERYVLTVARQGGQAVVLLNDAPYAAARHRLGGSGGRRAGVQRPQSDASPGRSQTRPVPWQALAVAKNRDWIRAEYERAMARTLGSGRRP